MNFSDKLKNLFKIESAKKKLDQAMAKVADVSGKTEMAEDLYLDILEKDPENVDAMINLGVIEFKKKDFDKALSFFSKAEKNSDELAPYSRFSDAALIYYSALCLNSKEAARSVQMLENHEFSKKYELDSMLILNFSYTMLGDIERHLEILFRLHGFFKEYEWNSKIYNSSGYAENSLSEVPAMLSDAEKLHSGPELSKITGMKLLEVIGKFENDRVKLEKTIELYNRDDRFKNHVLEFLDKNITEKSVKIDFYKFSAGIWEHDNDYKKHAACLRKILEMQEGQKRLVYLKKLAKCCVKLKLADEYQQCLSEIIKIDPDDCERAANYCEILIRDNNAAAAVSILENTNCLNNKRCMDMLGRLYFSAKAFKKALEVFRNLKDMSPENVTYIKLTGFCLLELSMIDQAMAHFEKVFQLNGLDIETGLRLMDIYTRAGRPDQACEILKEGFSKRWFSPTLKEGVKSIDKQAMEFIKRAVYLFEKSVNSEKKQVHASKLGQLLGSIFEDAGDNSRALAFYKKAWVCNPENHELGAVLARTLYKMDHIFEAIAIYKRILQNFENDLIPSWSYDNFKPLLNAYRDQMKKISDPESNEVLSSFIDAADEDKIRILKIIPDYCDLSLKLGDMTGPFDLIETILPFIETFSSQSMESQEVLREITNSLLSVKILILFRKNEVDKARDILEPERISYHYRLKILKSALIKGHHGFVLASELNRGMDKNLKGKELVEYLYITGVCNETAMNYEKALETYLKIREMVSDYRDIGIRITRLESNES